MFTWASRHCILTWALAWAVTSVGVFTADVFSDPRDGPLWIGIALGLVSWSVAGAATLHRRQRARGLVIWAAAYVLAFWLGAVWGDWFERNTVGTISSAGFIGALLGWAAGGAFGALVSCYVASRPRHPLMPPVISLVWGLSFFAGGFVGLAAAMYAAQVAAAVWPHPGTVHMALLIGAGVGAALGGAMASAIAMSVRRAGGGDSAQAAA